MKVAAQGSEERHEYSWFLTAELRLIERWRNEVALAARELGADCEAVHVVRAGVSELLSNVCKHVKSPDCQLVVEREDDGLCVRVFDHSHTSPVVTVPDWHSEAGRGLWMLRTMSKTMGYTLTPEGKWVWFHCPVSSWKGTP